LLRRHSGVSVAQKSQHLLQLNRANPPESPQPQPPGWPPTSNGYVRKALLLMEANISEPVLVSEIATKLDISVRHLQRCFKSHIGTSPRQTSILMRLRRAQHLLSTSSCTVTAIALELGFSNTAHFSRSYLREFKVRPSKSREPRMDVESQGRFY
jgi:transcriptional regulator GlxA family with amidase domain